jgi:hypothetical protein
LGILHSLISSERVAQVIKAEIMDVDTVHHPANSARHRVAVRELRGAGHRVALAMRKAHQQRCHSAEYLASLISVTFKNRDRFCQSPDLRVSDDEGRTTKFALFT